MGTRNFKSRAAYGKWLAYGHMHGDFEKTPGNQKVKIQGQPVKVTHSKGAKSSVKKTTVHKAGK